MPCNKQERPATKKNGNQRAATTSNALIWIQMTTDAPGDMIRMQNPNQAKRCLPEMAGAAIFIPERRIPSRTLLSFACGITAAPPKSRGAASWTFRRAQPQRRRFFHVSENQGKIQGKSHVLLCLFHRCILGRTWSSPSCMTLQWLKLRSTHPTAGRSSRSVLKRYCDGGALP